MANFPSPPQNQTLTRADFDEATFRRAIAQKGLPVRWEQAAECPCVSTSGDLTLDLSEMGDPSVSEETASSACPLCKGVGLFYHSPQDIDAVVTGAEEDYIAAQYGGVRDGVMNFTVNPEHLPSFGDRFSLIHSVMLFRETLVVGAGPTSTTRFKIATRTLNLASGETTAEVIYAHVADPVTKLGVVGGELVQGTDFNVVDGEIEWINKPATGSRVALTYFINPTYIVISYPNSIRDTRILKKQPAEKFISLPVRVQAKLEFLKAGQ